MEFPIALREPRHCIGLTSDTSGRKTGEKTPFSPILRLMDRLPVDEILRIAERHGATSVKVFGSRARGLHSIQ